MMHFKMHYFWPAGANLQGYPWWIKDAYKTGVQVRLWALAMEMGAE